MLAQVSSFFDRFGMRSRELDKAMTALDNQVKALIDETQSVWEKFGMPKELMRDSQEVLDIFEYSVNSKCLSTRDRLSYDCTREESKKLGQDPWQRKQLLKDVLDIYSDSANLILSPFETTLLNVHFGTHNYFYERYDEVQCQVVPNQEDIKVKFQIDADGKPNIYLQTSRYDQEKDDMIETEYKYNSSERTLATMVENTFADVVELYHGSSVNKAAIVEALENGSLDDEAFNYLLSNTKKMGLSSFIFDDLAQLGVDVDNIPNEFPKLDAALKKDAIGKRTPVFERD